MVRVKVCGNTSREDIELVGEFGADYVGVIVEVPTSTPRKVGVKRAAELFDSLPFTTGGVAVVMPQSLEEALELYSALRPEFMQIHSQVEPGFVHRLKTSVPCNAIKTVHMKDEESVREALHHQVWADALLLDTPSRMGGGSGRTHDWELARLVVEKVKKPVILAGGLNPSNVEEAIKTVRPFCVDVSSGVEARPGKKDPELLEEFIWRAKRAL